MQSELPQCLGGRGLDLKASSYAHHVNGPLLLNALLSILGQSQKRVHWDVRRCQKMPMMNAELQEQLEIWVHYSILSCWFPSTGPLLLNALLKYLGRSRDPAHHGEDPLDQTSVQDASLAMHSFVNRDSLAYGGCLVALLGLTAVLKV